MQYDKAAIEAARKTKKMGHPLYFYPETDTTNDRIRELAQEGVADGVAICCQAPRGFL